MNFPQFYSKFFSSLISPIFCPFSGEKKHHISLDVDSGIFNCVVCERNGGPVDFVRFFYGISLPEALEKLQHIYSSDDTPDSFSLPVEFLNYFLEGDFSIPETKLFFVIYSTCAHKSPAEIPNPHLAKNSNILRKNVSRYISDLEKKRLITVERRPGFPSLFSVNEPKKWTSHNNKEDKK